MTTLVPTFLGGTGVDATSDAVEFTNGLKITTGDAGTWAAPTNFNDIVIESNTNAGLIVGVPDADEGVIGISSPSNNGAVGYGMLYDFNVGIGRLFTSKVGASIRLDSDNQVANLTLSGASGSQFASFANDIGLASDNAVIFFGADNDIRLTHVPDSGLSIQGTDAGSGAGPILELYRNSSSPANADLLGEIYFYGEDDGGNKQEYASIKSRIIDVGASANKGRIEIFTAVANTMKSVFLATGAASNEEVVINEDSADINFRVESNGNANMLFVDAGNDRVGIGQSAPVGVLDIVGNSDSVPAIKIGANTTHGFEIYELATGGHLRLNRVVSGTSTQVLHIARDTGTVTLNDDLILGHDGAILKFGADSDVTQTHVTDVGLNWGSTRSGADSIFRFQNLANASASDIRLILQNGGTSGGDVIINLDGQATGAQFTMGVDTSADKFVIADADKGGFDGNDEIFTLADGGAATFIGNVSAGPGGTGTDKIVIKADGGSGAAGGGIFEVRSNGTFRGGLGNKAALAGSGTSTDLELRAASGIPITFAPNNTNALTLDTSGNAGFAGNIVIPNAGNIGSVSDTDAIAISSGGVVTFSQTPVFSLDVTVGDDIFLDSDSSVIHFGDDGEITLAHNHDAGLTLACNHTGTGGTFVIDQAGTGDPSLQIKTAATSYLIGVDNSDNDTLKIDYGTTGVGAQTGITLNTSGNVTMAGNLDVSGTIATTSSITGGSASVTQKAGLAPVGSIIAYGSTTVPTGWLACDDSAVSRTTFSVLFAVLGTSYGSGNGSTTFNVPDLRDRMVMGKGTNNSTMGASSTGASGSFVVATASGSASLTKTTGTFATSAKDSSQASALTNVTAGGHTHNVTMPAQVCMYIIKA
jgi:microcystin-dependent protein